MADVKEAEESPGSPWSSGTGSSMKTKEAVLCFVPASACRCTTPLISAWLDGQVKEGGMACPDTPFFSVVSHVSVLKQFPPNCCPATQGPNLPFPSPLFPSEGLAVA